MKKINVNTFIVFLLLLVGSRLHAAEMQDVIYLNNGSIVRGVIVEQSFKDGIYKIQTEGGSVFVYKTGDIDKIAKEPKVAAGQGGVNININNSNTPKDNVRPASVALPDEPPSHRHALGIGTWGLNIKDTKDDNGVDTTYRGAALFYQYGLNDHLALRVNLYSAEQEDFSNLKVSGLDGQLLLTSNARDNGFKIYIGAGYFSEKFKNDNSNYEKKYKGAEGIFGLGYNWSRIGFDFTGAVRPRSAYDVEGSDLLYVTGSLGLSFRF